MPLGKMLLKLLKDYLLICLKLELELSIMGHIEMDHLKLCKSVTLQEIKSKLLILLKLHQVQAETGGKHMNMFYQKFKIWIGLMYQIRF
jgi:hypothetical protein